MRGTPRIAVALLMLVVFLSSLVVSGFDSKRLAHDLDHGSRVAIAAIDHDDVPLADTDSSSDSQPSSDIEHRLLHAVNYYQSLPSSTLKFSWGPPGRTTPLLSSLAVVSSAELEPPFRPPRTPALI